MKLIIKKMIILIEFLIEADVDLFIYDLFKLFVAIDFALKMPYNVPAIEPVPTFIRFNVLFSINFICAKASETTD